MFPQLFSTGGGVLTLVRLGLRRIKPSCFVSSYMHSRPSPSELYSQRHFYSVLCINSQLHCSSRRTAGQLVFCRRYMNDTRRQRSSASYIVALFIFMIGAAYAGVPLYRMICQVSTGLYIFIIKSIVPIYIFPFRHLLVVKYTV